MSMLQTIVTSLFHGHSVKTPAMPDFNLERYLGEWHEIARLENWFERGLRKVYARYDRGEDGTVSVTNGGYDARTGERREVHARARVADAPNYLWLLSRNPDVEEDHLEQMLRCARDLGYDTSRLIYSHSFCPAEAGVGQCR